MCMQHRCITQIKSTCNIFEIITTTTPTIPYYTVNPSYCWMPHLENQESQAQCMCITGAMHMYHKRNAIKFQYCILNSLVPHCLRRLMCLCARTEGGGGRGGSSPPHFGSSVTSHIRIYIVLMLF